MRRNNNDETIKNVSPVSVLQRVLSKSCSSLVGRICVFLRLSCEKKKSSCVKTGLQLSFGLFCNSMIFRVSTKLVCRGSLNWKSLGSRDWDERKR